MSNISRYRRPGGLMQLIYLLETSDRVKKEELLHVVAQEDPGWAYFIRMKALSIERIMTWPGWVWEMVFNRMPLPMVAIAVTMAPPEERPKLLSAVDPQLKKHLQPLLEGKAYSQEHRWNVGVKIIQVVRELQSQGQLKISTFDPGLEVDSRLID